MEKRESLYVVGRNVNWYNHYGKQYGGSSKNLNYNYYVTQKFYFWVLYEYPETRKDMCTQCSLQHHLQQARYGSNLSAPQYMNG